MKYVIKISGKRYTI